MVGYCIPGPQAEDSALAVLSAEPEFEQTPTLGVHLSAGLSGYLRELTPHMFYKKGLLGWLTSCLRRQIPHHFQSKAGPQPK